VPVIDVRSAVTDRAMPKSTRYTKSASVTSTFDGLTSRCTGPVGVAGDLRHDPGGPRGLERPGFEGLLQVAAFDEPHVEVEAAVDLAVGVDRDDVRLPHPRDDLAEPRAEGLVGDERVG
jgi:hypothetical protein